MTTLFYMYEPFRESLIKSHLFYVDQAKERLLKQFDNLDEEADKYANAWLAERSHLFDPDRHDPGEFEEHAYDASIEFYQMLSDMRNRTILSIISGIFHEWDKQLRDWIVKEVNHWQAKEAIKAAIWKVTFEEIIDFIDMVIFKVKTEDYCHLLNKYRLLVNSYKHGEGNSFELLKSNHSEFFERIGFDDYSYTFSSYEDIKVSEKHIDQLSDAIVEFWKSIPDYVFDNGQIEVPNWFMKAYQKTVETGI